MKTGCGKNVGMFRHCSVGFFWHGWHKGCFVLARCTCYLTKSSLHFVNMKRKIHHWACQ